MNLQENVNNALMLSKVEQMHDFRGWSHKLPAFHFDKEWDVTIIPPFAGAIIRLSLIIMENMCQYILMRIQNLGGCVMKMNNQFRILNIMMVKILIDIILMSQNR